MKEGLSLNFDQRRRPLLTQKRGKKVNSAPGLLLPAAYKTAAAAAAAMATGRGNWPWQNGRGNWPWQLASAAGQRHSTPTPPALANKLVQPAPPAPGCDREHVFKVFCFEQLAWPPTGSPCVGMRGREMPSTVWG
jgi:hypothetical protein